MQAHLKLVDYIFVIEILGNSYNIWFFNSNLNWIEKNIFRSAPLVAWHGFVMEVNKKQILEPVFHNCLKKDAVRDKNDVLWEIFHCLSISIPIFHCTAQLRKMPRKSRFLSLNPMPVIFSSLPRTSSGHKHKRSSTKVNTVATCTGETFAQRGRCL